nr:putative capsid [Marmot picobirnavirus]
MKPNQSRRRTNRTSGNGSNDKNRGKSSEVKSVKSTREVEFDVPIGRINKADLKGVGVSGARPAQDPRWHAKSDALLRDTTSFTWADAVGSPLQWNFSRQPDQIAGSNTPEPYNDHYVNNAIGAGAYAVPGAIVMHYAPVIGGSNYGTSAINIATRAYYDVLRQANSGATTMDPPDVFMYLWGMTNCYLIYEEMLRVYGYLRSYQIFNKYMPDTLLRAAGYDVQSFQQNLAQFRAEINLFAWKLGSRCVPADIDLISFYTNLERNIILDAETAKAQMYMWQADTFYLWHEEQGEFQAVAAPYAQHVTTYSELIQFANELLEPVLNSQDFRTVSGDIWKAFGKENLFSVSPISEDYTVVPIYDTNWRAQIENAFFIGSPNIGNIVQIVPTDLQQQPYIAQELSFAPNRAPGHSGPGTIQRHLDVYQGECVFNRNKILNVHAETPDPGLIIDATRFIPAIERVSDPESEPTYFIECASVLATTMTIVAAAPSAVPSTGAPVGWEPSFLTISSSLMINQYDLNDAIPTVSDTQGILAARAIVMLSAFDWHPIVYLVYKQALDHNYNELFIGALVDFDQYRLISNAELKPINQAVLMSELSNPKLTFTE